MRVVVTRPELAAHRTAEKLVALGHDPVLLPLTSVVPTGHAIPEGDFDAIVLTSANAPAAIDPQDLKSLLRLPVWCVGAATARAAQAAGFANTLTGDGGDGAALAKSLALAIRRGARLLYLCGETRSSDLEIGLAAAGFDVVPVEVYRTLTVSYMTGELIAILSHRAADSVLLYSAEGARIFSELGQMPKVAQHFENSEFFCISERTAEQLPPQFRRRARIASRPDEASLLALLKTRSVSD